MVSKYLAHIEQSGLLEHTAGLLFGHYSAEPAPQLDEVLGRLADKYAIPVARCDDFGHGTYNALLPLGAAARLDTQTQSLAYGEALVRPRTGGLPNG